MRRLVVFWTLVVLSSACQGAIGSPPGAVGDPTHTDAAVSPSGDGSIAPQADASVVGPAADAGPPACAPTAVAVPKLLRLSNHEYRNMVSELLGAPVDEALFSRWTPVAEVYGFDTMSETRIDQQALEVQLDTAEALASIILATPSVTAHCPAVTPEEMPLCTSKPSYSARDDFADTQGRECWTYLDSSGAPMVFDNARSLWRKEPDETALLWREGTHPGSTVDPVRRWTSPVTGTATLTGVFADADPNGGDGVLVTIRHNGAAVFSQDLANGAQISFIFQTFGINLPKSRNPLSGRLAYSASCNVEADVTIPHWCDVSSASMRSASIDFILGTYQAGRCFSRTTTLGAPGRALPPDGSGNPSGVGGAPVTASQPRKATRRALPDPAHRLCLERPPAPAAWRSRQRDSGNAQGVQTIPGSCDARRPCCMDERRHPDRAGFVTRDAVPAGLARRRGCRGLGGRPRRRGAPTMRWS